MDTFLGQICAFPFNFNPRGWVACDGSLLQISQNAALFSLLGTTFGGDGRATFGVPDLRGRIAVGATNLGGPTNGLSPISQGQMGGKSSVALDQSNLPPHTHTLPAQNTNATSNSPKNAAPAVLNDSGGAGAQAYGAVGATTLNPQAIAVAGASQPVALQNPSLGIGYYIATQGIYPSRP